ncbi:MAG TPA: imidazolonepropionase [Anaerolineae bacterium]|nr:imidazolonepropionase [Anaerolineae bacterium]HQK14030.1 imidazolonepropionase [Anaerolineae bacterium]
MGAQKCDLLVHSADQLCVIPPQDGGPQRGTSLGNLGMIEDGAVAIAAGRVIKVGPTCEVRPHFNAAREIDARGKVVCPGFVDPHTHLVWMGDRAAEFEQRIAGATYMEIMAAGGGIMSTVRATRDASVDELVAAMRPRLDRMLAHGTTTVEVKTGYGLETAAELRQLEAIVALDRAHPVTLVPTFLGAHAVPAEYRQHPDAYVDVVVHQMLPAVVEKSRTLGLPRLPFCDVFCEDGAFDLAQSRRILEAARALGFPLKIHVDEFASLGGARLAVALGATSADHLVTTPPEDIAMLGASETVAVSLPCTPFGLGQHDYTPARALLEAGAALALATDCNPGTAWNESMPFVIALACRYLRITPAQALVAVTLNAAFAVGLGDRVGSLTPGYAGDLLILDIPDYRYLGYRFGVNPVALVVKRGEIIYQTTDYQTTDY